MMVNGKDLDKRRLLLERKRTGAGASQERKLPSPPVCPVLQSELSQLANLEKKRTLLTQPNITQTYPKRHKESKYEDWLAKKAEREGDMESGGMRNWEPKERAIARPSDLSPHSANSLHTASPAELPPTDMASWTYGCPHSQSQTGMSKPREPQGHIAPPQSEDQQAAIDIAQRQVMIPYGHEAFYAHPAYWDPSCWWGMNGGPNAMAVHATNPQLKIQSLNQVDMPKEGEMAPEEQQAYELSNMMKPYQWSGMMDQGAGYPGMHNNPYMMRRDPSVIGTMPAPSQSAATEDKNLKPFDSSKMKQGRLGHYGYLEGRELAGPPIGHLPAGIQSQYASSQTGHGTTTAGAGACSTTSYQGNGSWGDPANVPRARYDGAASGYVQADLDSVTTAWTRYGADGSVMNGMNGSGLTGHWRLREGRV
uniref:Uncharacterized protein n=1 Tax=Cryptococcus bacillisporus CA1280 TaxID=1296109 RepID=A0A0D0UCE3_CRYGA|nr:hypothetical protein I312_04953 [Cryptococcus bacillisporus CA1280]